mgnify:FL=1
MSAPAGCLFITRLQNMELQPEREAQNIDHLHVLIRELRDQI